MSFKVFLDDYRDPSNVMPYMLDKMGKRVLIYTEGWVVVRSFMEFKIAVLSLQGIGISHVSFDYDLIMTDGKRRTGADCAEELKRLYGDKPLPEILIHSTNDKGIKKLEKILL